MEYQDSKPVLEKFAVKKSNFFHIFLISIDNQPPTQLCEHAKKETTSRRCNTYNERFKVAGENFIRLNQTIIIDLSHGRIGKLSEREMRFAKIFLFQLFRQNL